MSKWYNCLNTNNCSENHILIQSGFSINILNIFFSLIMIPYLIYKKNLFKNWQFGLIIFFLVIILLLSLVFSIYLVITY